MKIQYRVITDEFEGYEAQWRNNWWNKWIQMSSCEGLRRNTSKTIRDAVYLINEDKKDRELKIKEEKFKPRVVWTDGVK